MNHEHDQPIRIGAVNYLNSKPLIAGLEDLPGRAELILDYPSRLADSLAEGQLDVALIPTVECFRQADYEIVSDACVATRGPVLSVKLHSRVPFGSIRSLALDEGSRTSAALVRIMLAERYGVLPRLEPLPIGRTLNACSTDAILLIGDRAIQPPDEAFACEWDLGAEWLRWTGLPFVFAVWAARSQTSLRGIDEEISKARDRGLEEIDDIARREAVLLGLDETVARNYLTKNLHFRLGSSERNGLRLFQKLAVKLGLAPKGVELVFRDCTAAR